MAEPEDMILPLLREMRAEIAICHQKMDEAFLSVDKRFAAIELAQADCLRAIFHSIAVKAAFLERRI
ncbi:MAG: hypothetical protein QOJ84_4515 [Bradyrhizobium sp.]|jgi:hypothetical protein|nr:hypothetical protein [Bradyrhizobium sp.]